MKKMSASLIACAIWIISYTISPQACTDFRLVAKDGTVIISRSMEFATDLKSHLRTSTRDRTFKTMVNGKPGMSWKAVYGYVYLDGSNQDVAVDGINEAGLSFEALYLPGNTQYQSVSEGKEHESLPYFSVGDWILGNFKTVDEVKNALNKIFVVTQLIPGLGNIVFPLHFSVYEKSGKGIVIEYVNGLLNISDSIGVMTNSPTYGWHVISLNNYLNLSPYNPKPVVVDGVNYTATGQGAGAIGLPGDSSPTSRFTKIAFMTLNSYPVNNAMDLLNLAQHIINNVDIPTGISRSVSNGKESSDYTQWVVFKDLTHKIFYYRTYNDMTVRAIDMSKLDFAPTAKRLDMNIMDMPFNIDLTDKFKASPMTQGITMTA